MPSAPIARRGRGRDGRMGPDGLGVLRWVGLCVCLGRGPRADSVPCQLGGDEMSGNCELGPDCWLCAEEREQDARQAVLDAALAWEADTVNHGPLRSIEYVLRAAVRAYRAAKEGT